MRPTASIIDPVMGTYPISQENPLIKADFFTLVLRDGTTTYRWTDFDQSIEYSFSGDVFLAQTSTQGGAPLIQRTGLTVKNTIEVPELTLKLFALDTDFIGGLSIKTQIHNGYLDGAWFYLDRVFFPRKTMLNSTPTSGLAGIRVTWPAIGTGTSGNGHYPGAMFTGVVSAAKINALGAELTIKGANVILNQPCPRNQYQLNCMHAFCDAGCTLVAATYTTAQTVGASPTKSFIPWGSVPASPGIYTYGKVTFTSGAAVGQVRTVRFATSAGLQLQYPLYNLPAPGDTFNAMKGCSKSYNDGSGQSCTDYSNTQHFRGFPFIPPAETAV